MDKPSSAREKAGVGKGGLQAAGGATEKHLRSGIGNGRSE